MNQRCMNPNCFSTLLPRVPGLTICEKCADNAPKEVKQNWFLHKPEYRKWVNSRVPVIPEDEPGRQKEKVHSRKLANELLHLLESPAVTRAMSTRELHELIDRSVSQSLVRSTLKWMMERGLATHIGVPTAKGGCERYWFAASRPELSTAAPNSLISAILQVIENSPGEITAEEIILQVSKLGCERWTSKNVVWSALRIIRRDRLAASRQIAGKGIKPRYAYSSLQQEKSAA